MESVSDPPKRSQTEKAPSWLSTEVSIVANAHKTKTATISIGEALAAIKSGKHQAEIREVRAATGDELAKLKEALPAIMWSGTFRRRSAAAITAHSGFLCADLDNVPPDRLEDVRAAVIASPHVGAIFTSPGGHGLKALFRIPASVPLHKSSFRAIRDHVRLLTGLDVDRACSDVPRLCFVSHDPDLWIRTTPPECLNVTEDTECHSVSSVSSVSSVTSGSIEFLTSISSVEDALRVSMPTKVHENNRRLFVVPRHFQWMDRRGLGTMAG